MTRFPILLALAAGTLLVIPASVRAQAAAADSAFQLAQQASGAEAEQAWLRFVAEHPMDARAEDALLRLADLELARGDRERAVAHLERVAREYPASPRRARATLTLARLHLDRRELAEGCLALGAARAAVRPEDAELRNQIDYYAPRCEGVDTARVAAAGSRESGTRAVDSNSGGAPQSTPPAATPPAPSRSGPAWSVQVGAFNTRAEADRTVKRLKARGQTARVVGPSKPYRVRIGRYATRAAATEALRTLKKRGVSGFVTEAEAAR